MKRTVAITIVFAVVCTSASAYGPASASYPSVNEDRGTAENAKPQSDPTKRQRQRQQQDQHRGKTKNVLFLLVDDGGFELAPWGNRVTHTPNIHALAERDGSIIFDRAYTAVSSCSPSRSAILSGLPTHENGMYGLHQLPGENESDCFV